MDPGVIGLVSGRPDRRAYPFPCEIKGQRRRLLHPCRLEAMRRLHLIVEPVLGGPLVDGVEQPALLQVGQGALVTERAGKLCLAFREPGERAHEPHPQIGERVEIQRGPLWRPDQLGRRNPPCAHDVVDLVVSLVVQTGAVHPPQDVLAAVGARPCGHARPPRASPAARSGAPRPRSERPSRTRPPPAHRHRVAPRAACNPSVSRTQWRQGAPPRQAESSAG